MITTHGIPTIACPQCGQPIPITLPRLLSGMPMHCTCCRMELRIDAAKSAQSLEIARDISEKQIDKYGI